MRTIKSRHKRLFFSFLNNFARCEKLDEGKAESVKKWPTARHTFHSSICLEINGQKARKYLSCFIFEPSWFLRAGNSVFRSGAFFATHRRTSSMIHCMIEKSADGEISKKISTNSERRNSSTLFGDFCRDPSGMNTGNKSWKSFFLARSVFER